MISFIIWGLVGIGVGYIVYTTVAYTWPIILLALVWGTYNSWDNYHNTDAGAYKDVAYYCEVLGTDKTSANWNAVYDYVLFDERHIDDTGANYYSSFRSMSCDVATSKAVRGEYETVKYSDDKLGFIRRYFYYQDGQVKSLYRDKDQFLWQRALFLRVQEGCNLDRETSQCYDIPENVCNWTTMRGCAYDSGKGKMHTVERKNLISNTQW